jgi:hypothetical protein
MTCSVWILPLSSIRYSRAHGAVVPSPNGPPAIVRLSTSSALRSSPVLASTYAWLTMPPLPLEYQGRELAARFLTATALRPGWTARLLPTRANGQPAFGFYARDPHAGGYYTVGLMVLMLTGAQISAMTRFDPGTLPRFGLPATLTD